MPISGNTVNVTMQRRSYADALHATLPRATEIVRSQRIITKAILNGPPVTPLRSRWMALADKAAHFADRMRSAPAKLEAVFDKLLAEVDEMEKMGDDAATSATAVVADAKKGVRAVVDVMNQLTNGTPAS